MASISRASTAPQGQSEGREGKGFGLRGLRKSRHTNGGNWEPTVLYLMLLVILEFVAYGALRYAFRSVHGG